MATAEPDAGETKSGCFGPGCVIALIVGVIAAAALWTNVMGAIVAVSHGPQMERQGRGKPSRQRSRDTGSLPPIPGWRQEPPGEWDEYGLIDPPDLPTTSQEAVERLTTYRHAVERFVADQDERAWDHGSEGRRAYFREVYAHLLSVVPDFARMPVEVQRRFLHILREDHVDGAAEVTTSNLRQLADFWATTRR